MLDCWSTPNHIISGVCRVYTYLLSWKCVTVLLSFCRIVICCNSYQSTGPSDEVWQSPGGNRWLTHWASLLRWIWSISEYNLKTRDSPKRTMKSGPFVMERRGSGPAKQKPKHNPCRPVGPKMTTWPCVAGNHRHLNTECLARVNLIVSNPKGIPTRSMENMKWYSPSQVSTAKHVLPTADRNSSPSIFLYWASFWNLQHQVRWVTNVYNLWPDACEDQRKWSIYRWVAIYQ